MHGQDKKDGKQYESIELAALSRLSVRVRSFCYTTIGLFICFLVADVVLELGDLRKLLFIRAMSVAALFVVIRMSHALASPRWISLLPDVIFSIMTLSVCSLVLATGGVSSPYHEPLAILFVAFATIFFNTYQRLAALCFAAVGTYNMALIVVGTPFSNKLFTNNSFLICAVAGAVTMQIMTNRLADQDALRREHEESVALLKTQRLVAEGLAHDILNPLGFIAPRLMLMQRIVSDALTGGQVDRVALKEKADGHYKAIITAIDRVKAELDRLRKYTRGLSTERVEVDINDVIRRTVMLVNTENTITANLQATIKPFVQLGVLENVILNLLINAQQAGGVSCKVSVKALDGPEGPTIVVNDEGPGMPADILAHIFDPYFTTKNTGTGMGLAMARTSLADQGGSIVADSEVGRGSSFTIKLPRPLAT